MIALACAACASRSSPQSPAAVGLTIAGHADNSAGHLHGGEPAVISTATFTVTAHHPRADIMTITGVDLLWRMCLSTGRYRVIPLAIGGSRKVALAVTGGTVVRINFRPKKVYQGCEEYAYRLHARVGKVAIVAEVPLDVIRGDPM